MKRLSNLTKMLLTFQVKYFKIDLTLNVFKIYFWREL